MKADKLGLKSSVVASLFRSVFCQTGVDFRIFVDICFFFIRMHCRNCCPTLIIES